MKALTHNEWYNMCYLHYDSDSFFSTETGWNACKMEVLKVLKNKAINTESGDYKYILEQVEKL